MHYLGATAGRGDTFVSPTGMSPTDRHVDWPQPSPPNDALGLIRSQWPGDPALTPTAPAQTFQGAFVEYRVVGSNIAEDRQSFAAEHSPPFEVIGQYAGAFRQLSFAGAAPITGLPDVEARRLIEMLPSDLDSVSEIRIAVLPVTTLVATVPGGSQTFYLIGDERQIVAGAVQPNSLPQEGSVPGETRRKRIWLVPAVVAAAVVVAVLAAVALLVPRYLDRPVAVKVTAPATSARPTSMPSGGVDTGELPPLSSLVIDTDGLRRSATPDPRDLTIGKVVSISGLGPEDLLTYLPDMECMGGGKGSFQPNYPDSAFNTFGVGVSKSGADGARIDSIGVWTGEIKTRSGAHVGMSLADLKAAYGSKLVEQEGQPGTATVWTVSGARGHVGFTVGVAGGSSFPPDEVAYILVSTSLEEVSQVSMHGPDGCFY